MTEDVVRTLGFLTLGSRFRRIGERLQADTQRIMDELDVPLQAAQYPFLAAVDRLGPLAVGELAGAVGITQPGTTRSLAQLERQGLVHIGQAPDDQRRKVVTLTTKGQQLLDSARRHVWPRIEAAVADLCAALSGPLLEQLAAIEDGLAELPLHRRPAGARKVRR